MINQEEVLSKIEKLRDEYEYWFEVFRREKDPKKQHEAKQRYKPAIQEIIRLQEEYGVRSVPKYSSSERAKMVLDHENKRLMRSKEQIDKTELTSRFDIERGRMENEIKKEIETQGDLYIKKVKEEMRANNLDISRIEEIINELEPKSLFTKFSKIDRALRKVTLATVLPVNFIEFYSGESFTKNFHKEYNKAIELLENSEIYRADEIIQKALSLFDKAGILSKLSSGAAYFNMKKKEALSNWDAIKKKIIEEKLHSERQLQVRKIIKDLAKSEPGVLQTELYKRIEDYARNEISEAAYFMNKEGNLRREKKGNTYKLFVD